MSEQVPFLTVFIAIALLAIGPVMGNLLSRYRSKSQHDSDSSLRFGTTVTGLSAAAAGNSAFIVIGALGLGYTMGISALGIALGFWIGDILFWYLMANRLIGRVQETGVEEISELIAAQTISSSLLPLRVAAVVVIIAVGLYCSAQFLAVGKIMIEMFGFNELTALSLIITLALISILLGGLASSMLVNVYQSVLMIIAAILLVVFVGTELLLNLDLVAENADRARLLNPLGPFSFGQMMLFIGTYIVQGFLFATCTPNVLARITKGNVNEIPRIRWVYMGFMQSLWWLMTCVGVGLALLNVSAGDPDSVGAAFAVSNFSPLLLGLFLAGVGAASLSTGESQLLVTANALVKDIMPGKFSSLSEKGKRIAMIIGRLIVAVCLLFVLMTINSQQIGNLVIQSSSIMISAFAIPAMLFIFKIPIGGRAMAVSILAGTFASIWVRLIWGPPAGQEIFAGLALSGLVIALALIAKTHRNDRQGH